MPVSQLKRVTREDVARRAGVSTATISYVINNGPRPVARETRARVLRVIEELGYYPNELARSLRIKQTSTIGLVIPDLLNPFYADLARSFEQICFSRGYVVMVCNTNRETDKERRFAEVLRAKQVDGVVFLPDAESMEALSILSIACIPVVVLEHDIEGIPCIAIDDFRGGVIATDHLMRLGHRRIGFIQQRPNHTTSQRRLDGFTAALQASGLAVDPSLIIPCSPESAAGAMAMQLLLSQSPDITAVFAHNDLIALGAMHAIREAGLSIPDDISVIGYDDTASAAFYAPPLTTISYPKEAMATAAARQLFGILEAGQEGRSATTELLPVKLVVRQSTAPA